MVERCNASRSLSSEGGSISIDEHRSLPCIVYDRSESGVRVALPDAEIVPDRFVLSLDAGSEVLVCRALWRKAEEIGAATDERGMVQVIRPSLRRPLATV
jgi:hypothetical protein